jgi:hypothetical protein
MEDIKKLSVPEDILYTCIDTYKYLKCRPCMVVGISYIHDNRNWNIVSIIFQDLCNFLKVYKCIS